VATLAAAGLRTGPEPLIPPNTALQYRPPIPPISRTSSAILPEAERDALLKDASVYGVLAVERGQGPITLSSSVPVGLFSHAHRRRRGQPANATLRCGPDGRSSSPRKLVSAPAPITLLMNSNPDAKK